MYVFGVFMALAITVSTILYHVVASYTGGTGRQIEAGK